MSALATDRVTVIKPGQTYVGKQGFTYGAGASAETVGAMHICMNVLPMPPGARAKAHYHKGIETIALHAHGRMYCLLRRRSGAARAGAYVRSGFRSRRPAARAVQRERCALHVDRCTFLRK